jgi:addiction module HigA family antidote
MKTKKPLNIHPGELLRIEFLEGFGISQYRLAKEIGIPESRVSDIVLGKRAISADTALRLAAFFGNSARFWLNLQNVYDLQEAEASIGAELLEIRPVAGAADAAETSKAKPRKKTKTDRARRARTAG